MRAMEEKICAEGTVISKDILKVGNFLNQQIDTAFLAEIADEIARLYTNENITKIMTIESSGIAIAAAAGMKMVIPVIFAKKNKSSNVDGDTYQVTIHSFTHGNDYQAVVSRDYLKPEDKVLLIDDFLASGNALEGLVQLVEMAGATLAGAAVAIEKKFQGGGDELRARGIRIESLACIESMDEDGIVFTTVNNGV
ncbi:MAG: xanthine phosphoribosyltransferase [Firmicutes bacterium]|nr:xanthine phosphoribosyltransferase [Bacillota bacterium]